jgi:hypothetical protein
MSINIQGDKKTQEVYRKYSIARGIMRSLHGSGIDFDWAADETTNFIRLYNGYDQMDDMGYYIGAIWFTIWISKKNPKQFRITFQDKDSYRAAVKWATNQYLDDVVGETISEIVKKMRTRKTGNRKGGK